MCIIALCIVTYIIVSFNTHESLHNRSFVYFRELAPGTVS